MNQKLPQIVNVLLLTPSNEQAVEKIRAVAPDRLNVVQAVADFLPEMEQEWPEEAVRNLKRRFPEPQRTAEEREALVRDAHVIYLSIPYPKTIPQRAKNLRWVHFTRAGVDSLRGSPWWNSPFPLTSSRKRMGTRPIAETVMAATFMFAKRLDKAVEYTLAKDYDTPPRGLVLIEGKTMGIVGLGGIGGEIAKLAKGCGMHIVANRRTISERQFDVDGVDELFPSSELHAMLGQCDFVAVSAPLTDETERMFDAAAFTAMKQGAYFLNIARGEMVVESALVEALKSGHLSGAYLDVWDDDIALPPSPELQSAPNVIFTPHMSSMSDAATHFTLDVLCENLERLLKGEPLENVVDWSLGY